MAFTNIAAVQNLLSPRDYDGVTDLQQFIDSADIIVQRLITITTSSSSRITLSTIELEMIERWLAAHMYCMNDPIYQSKNVGRSSGTFMGQGGLGLESTRYGQTAVKLDTSGVLNSINKRAVASINWLGKPRHHAPLVPVTPSLMLAIAAPVNNSAYSPGNLVTLVANPAGGIPNYSVQFTLDNANLNNPVNSPPYQSVWNTTGIAAGIYQLGGYVTDKVNNTSIASAVNVTIT